MYKSTFSSRHYVGHEWSASRPGRFIHGERTPGPHWREGWVNPGTGLDDVERIKFLILPALELQPPAVQPVASHYTDCAILAHNVFIHFSTHQWL
jgi:hypothetical protein